MNFFGHAAVASWSASEPGVVLGAMLPDFASMCGGRIDGSADATVERGIALHHATDGAFHQLPVVTGLMRELDALLLARGCARGPRRAVAHIGVELLLDGVLVAEPAYRSAYLAGIGHDAPLAWRDGETAPRFALLVDRLRARGVPDDLKLVDAIVLRLARVLAGRPLLAPSPSDLQAIHGALGAHRARVEVATEAILRGLRAQNLSENDDL